MDDCVFGVVIIGIKFGFVEVFWYVGRIYVVFDFIILNFVCIISCICIWFVYIWFKNMDFIINFNDIYVVIIIYSIVS